MATSGRKKTVKPRSKVAALGARIKAVRLHFKYRQEGFARKIGVSRSYLSEVESGKNKASIEMLAGIAEKFPDVRLEWLLSKKGAMFTTFSESGFKVDKNLGVLIGLAQEIVAETAKTLNVAPKTDDRGALVGFIFDLLTAVYASARANQKLPERDAIIRAIREGRQTARRYLSEH